MQLSELVEMLRGLAENVLKVTADSSPSLDRIGDMVKAYTSTYGRSIVLTDSFTVDLVLPFVYNIVIRGSVVILLLDLDGRLPQTLPTHMPVVETYPEDGDSLLEHVRYALNVGEALEHPVLLRVPYCILRELVQRPASSEIMRVRGSFFRDWKFKYAWLADNIVTRLALGQEADKLGKLVVEESIRQLEQRIVSKERPYTLVLDWPAYMHAKAQGKATLCVRLYSIDAVRDILLRLRQLASIEEVYTSDTRVYHRCRDLAKTTLTSFSNNVEDYLRNCAVHELSNIARSILAAVLRISRTSQGPCIVLSNIRVLNIEQLLTVRGKYDVRSVTFQASRLSELVDMHVSSCSPEIMKVLEERLPEDQVLICIQDDLRKLSLDEFTRLKELTRSIVITKYSDIMYELTRRLGIPAVILDPADSAQRYISLDTLRNVRVVFVYVPAQARIIANLDYCDGCGECSRAECSNITLIDGKVRVSCETCRDCCACTILCTRGALAIEEVP